MLQRIFWGDFNIATMLFWFFLFYVLKVAAAIFIPQMSILVSLFLSGIIGFGFGA